MPIRRKLALLLGPLALLCVFAASAQATSYQRPLIGTLGSVEEPMFRAPQSIAVDPITGDVLVGDAGESEEQHLEVDATAGTFKLSFEGDTTEDIPFDVNDEALREILKNAFGPGVTAGGEGEEEHLNDKTQRKAPFHIYFSGGTYANRDVEQMICEDGSAPLSGGSGCSVTTLADGKPLGLYRYHPDGTPDAFAALGSNAIDGMAGPGGKPCAEEPASCDQTPQGEIVFNERSQISVDPTTGNIYLSQDEGWVDIFSPAGDYLGQLTAAGTKKFSQACGVVIDSDGAVYVAQGPAISKFVPSADPPVNTDNVANFPVQGYEGPCRMAVGAGASAGWIFIVNSGGNAGPWTVKVNAETGELSGFAKGYDRRVTVDPTNGNPIVELPTLGNPQRLVEFDGSLEVASSVLSKLVLEKDGAKDASARDVAANAAGDVYVAYSESGLPPPPRPVRIYGQPAIVPTVTIDSAEEVTADGATLSGTVEADGIDVEECFFEWGKTFPNGNSFFEHKLPCEETVPTDSEAHEVHAEILGLEPNGVKYNFRLAAKNENGTERSGGESLVSASTVETKEATVTGEDSATLHGRLRPEASQYTECVFEWGATTSFGFEHAEPCQPEAGEIPADTGVHKVSLPLSGLQEATEYRFRLKATNGEGTIKGATFTFETFGAPRIVAIGARDATRSAVSLEAKINPSGFETTYRFEWGTDTDYGHIVAPQTIAAGEKPVRVATVLSGLATGTLYHYRLLAESSAGPADSGDQIAETLNSCGLPEERCFELVSRRDAGPVAIPGKPGAGTLEKHYQAATSGPGGLAYSVESAYPDATTGYSVLYRGLRGADGWSSAQVRPSVYGEVQWLADDLSCGLLVTAEALTADPGPSLGTNLYRSNPDGTYTAVPRLAPEGSTGGGFATAGAAQDCHKVVFSSGRRYHGVSVAAGSGERLYEWDEGNLRGAGVVPGPSGDVLVEAKAAAFNAVSADGSRVFFTATRQVSPDEEEIGKQGVFVREDGTTTKDLSLSETSTPSADAKFQYATPDGSKVFFTANAGLTDESSPAGTDLYEYDLEEEDLTDLSVDPESGGAEVGGFVAASANGSHVYFIARGQFLPAHGKTKAENKSDNTYSLYGVKDGEVSFVGTVSNASGEVSQLATPGDRNWVSSVSPDGRYLLFQTMANVTGYDSGGAQEAYLYDADKGSTGTICISCRPDGQPSVAPSSYTVLTAELPINNPAHPPRFLTSGKDGPQAFFSSLDALAPGAVEGQNNVYEWSHGQVFRLVSAREGQQSSPKAGYFAAFVGADATGSNAYLVTPESLNWEDPDERLSVYVARIGGGFPEPAPEARPCDPKSEGSCQGAATPTPAVAPGAASANFSGSGNVKPRRAKKQKKAHRRRGKKQKRKARGKSARHKRANHHRRAGK